MDLSEAAEPDPRAYPTFNAFFTRALLKPGARRRSRSARAADAGRRPHQPARTGSSPGKTTGRIFQAKGQSFTAAELLGDDEAAAAPFANGLFATVYLSPRDYHRVHAVDRHPARNRARPDDCSRSAPTRSPRCRACSRATNAWPATSTPTSALMCVVMVGALLVSAWKRSGAGKVESPPYGGPVRAEGLPRPRHRGRTLRRNGALQPRQHRDRAAAARRGELAPQLAAEMPVRLVNASRRL